MTFRLRVVNGVRLTGPDDQDVRAVLAQPKRLALLVYLAVAQPAGFHRRDTLLSLFWPESGEDAARAALSRALHHLRQALGAGVVVSRGDDEVAVDASLLTSDAREIAEALERGDPAAALALYAGDFLNGFHIDDVAGFDHWVEAERERIRTMMFVAASDASRAAERAGDVAAASMFARRASELSPYTESAMLEVMRLMDAQGNRADAILAYDAFAKRLRDDLDAGPGAALVAAAERIRRGGLPAAPQRATEPGTGPAEAFIAIPALKSAPRMSWSRTTRGGAYALAALVVTIVAFMVMRATGVGPAATLLSSGRLQKKEPILLADFRITNVDSSLGRVASDAVRQALSESSVITLVPPDAVTAALKLAQRPPSSPLDVSLARELAIRQGFKAIIDGEVAGVAGGYLITLRLVGADSLSPLAILTASGRGPQGFIDAVDKVARAFRAKAGESLWRVQRAPALSDVTTGSLDALRKYSAALHASNGGDYAKGVALLREATTIDTGFAMAWLKLASDLGDAAAGTGRSALASSDSARSRAFAMQARLSERERLAMVSSSRRSGRVNVIAAFEAILSLGFSSDSAAALLGLGRWYATRQDWARADSFDVLSMRANPKLAAAYLNQVWALYCGGRLAEARDAANRFERLFPTAWFAQQLTRDMLWHEGRLGELRRQVDSVDAAPGSAQMHTWVVVNRMSLAVRDGRLSEWRRLVAQGHAADSARGVSPTLESAALVTSVEAEVRAPGARAVEALDAALRQQPLRSMPEIERPYFKVAIAYARAGYPDRAQTVLAQSTSDVADTSLLRVWAPEYHEASGELLLAERRPAEAIGEFRRGFMLPDGPRTIDAAALPLDLARAFDAAAQPDSAIVQYERYLSTPGFFYRYGLERDASWLPFVHERLGGLYEAKRATALAAEHYRAFVDLWKNADSELQPRVAEARRRLARLTLLEKTR